MSEGAAPEELARANVYGLIARLFYAAPDAQLLAELLHAPHAEAEGTPTALGKEYTAAWQALVGACGDAYPVVLENEHTDLFAAPGKTEVTPYLFNYVMRYSSETPLVGLRAQLAQWQLGRRGDANEPEDHIAGLCDVMRIAIAVQQRSLEEQKQFFLHFLHPGAVPFCSAVSASPNAHFYRRVARFAKAFLDVEHEAFATLG